MPFLLPTTRLPHLTRHFGAQDLAGSYFLTEVFTTPGELVEYINTHEPVDRIDQGHGRVAFLFLTSDGKAVGTCGLAKRADIDPSYIVREQREGFSLDIGYVESLPLTTEFCVVADRREDGLHIITAFPGGYARPFAQKCQPVAEYALNEAFWKEHILLKTKTSLL